MSTIDRGQAARNVIELLGIFRGSFAAYGTALGINREGNILAHDLDTDIAIMSDDFTWGMVNDAVQRGFSIHNVYGMRHHGLEVAFLRDGIKTDVMVLYRDNEKVWNSLWDNGGRNGLADEIRHEYDSHLIIPTVGRLNGVQVPTLGESYLTHVYGDWKTPVTKWNWRTDHLCK